MNLHEFLAPPSEIARREGPHNKIVMSSRVRLARNVKGMAFPGWAKKAERIRILDIIRPAVEALAPMGDCFSETMDNLTLLDKNILVERHLISREHAAKNAGSGLVFNRDETLCVMINEEDHLRMQALRPGLQLKQAWQAIDAVDTKLEKKLDYAFNPEIGYLTACPTNLGTGIRVSAMLHLPGLVLGEQINQIIQAVNKLGLAVRGLYGEGTEALGNVFQVSNQMTLGESEPEFGAMVPGERQAQFGSKLGREAFNLIAIDRDRTAAEDGFDHATAGAAGKITHNEYLERRVRFRGRVHPALARFDIHYHVGIRSFWHLVIP